MGCVCGKEDYEPYYDPSRRRSDAARLKRQMDRNSKLRESLRKKVIFWILTHFSRNQEHRVIECDFFDFYFCLLRAL